MKIQLEHQSIIKGFCEALCLPISEYSFSNIYLFRNFHEFEFHELENNHYALTGLSHQRERFFMPLYHPHDWSSCIAEAKKHTASYVYPVPEEWWAECPQCVIEASADDSDYVVETEKVRTYQGRHYDGHRYNVRKLLDSVTMDVRPIQSIPIKHAQDIVEQWQLQQAQAGVITDRESCLEALERLDLLGLDGFAFYVNGHPEGLIIGQPLKPNMYVLQFAKAASRFSGMYQYMYQYFAQKIPQQYLFMNWQQDLGILGLRRAKNSFHPSFLVKKGRIMVP